MLWTPTDAENVARELLAALPDRLQHVAGVAARAQAATGRLGLSNDIVAAAWLHDIGYAPDVAITGFHPLDGARYLQLMGAPAAIVSLVAYHSGAEFEALERGSRQELHAIARPDSRALDVLTYADMTTSATGQPVTFDERLADIETRYPDEHPVRRAFLRSTALLMGSVQRVALVDAVSR